jgi:hypothetical protein
MHLFCDISSHGFGHLAQTAPVLNALRERVPPLDLTVRCGLSPQRIARRIGGDFTHIAEASDFGLVMKSALEVDVAASLAAYRAFHADWEARVAREAQTLRALAPDLVVSNVSYLALAGAKQAGIPAIAMSSLNWADIATPYFEGEPHFGAIGHQIGQAYGGADAFLLLTPGMDMATLANVVPIGPVAQLGADRRSMLNATLGLKPETRLVLVAMGGIGLALDAARWPSLPDVVWVAPRSAGLIRSDVADLEAMDVTVSDLIVSCDCIVTKSGYGTFVEAAAAGTPVLYVQRPDWPEEPALAAWLSRATRAIAVNRAEFEQGEFGDRVLQLATGPRPTPVALTGIAEAANFLAARLCHSTHPAPQLG